MPWMYAIIGFLVGAVVGVIISRLSSPGYKKNKTVHDELKSAKFELEQLRQELVDHFSETEETLDTFGKVYTKLYKQMAKRSSEMLPNLPEQDNPFDKKVTLDISEDVTEEKTEAETQDKQEPSEIQEPPRDYAPGASGQLSDKPQTSDKKRTASDKSVSPEKSTESNDAD